MPLIKPRTWKAVGQAHRTAGSRDERNPVRLCPVPRKPTDYVLNQVIDTVLARTRTFRRGALSIRKSFVPRPGSKSHRARRPPSGTPRAQRTR